MLGDGWWKFIEYVLYLIKYCFISSMNIFYCSTDVVSLFYRMPGDSQGSHSVDQEEVVPEEVSDTSKDVMISNLLEKNHAQEQRILQLEAENMNHQHVEQQYKDATHQALMELAEMRV